MSKITNGFSTRDFDSNIPLIIVNPVSAGGATGDVWAKTASDFAANFGAFSVEFTKSGGDGMKIALEQAKLGRKFIIACGGDGTINEVANGILQSETNCELGILPSGTGGDFRRTLSVPANSIEAAKYLKNGATKMIDVGRAVFVNHEGETVSRYFLGIASFGLSTKIIEKVKKDKPFDWLPFRKLSGQAGFAWSTLQTTLALKTTKARITIDENREKTLETVNFCVANARYFGGGMKIAPDAKLDDGLLDVVMFGDLSSAKILVNSYKLYQGTHLNVDNVHHTNAKRIEIKPVNDEIVPFELDGELVGNLPLTIEIVPNAMQIRAHNPSK
ncbi:MAG: diacylglycerol kinase family lipid kinase [Pyrinomonadaceae bacterium]|nr:diacylglycerol kinase family lipid kinase [Pyrinomonadaceae bacterium]